MKQQLLFPIRLFIIWLLIFTFQRVLFVFHFYGELEGHYSDLFVLPWHALRLDASGISYLMGLPFLISLFAFIPKTEKGIRIINRVIFFIMWTLIVISSLIAASEIVSYYEWQTKLSSKIWIHFTTPSEIFRTSSGSYTYWFISYFVLELVFAWLIYVRLFRKNYLGVLDLSITKKIGTGLIYFFIGTSLIGLGVRGGVQEIPVSATDAYYSQSRLVNDISVNPVWNFIHMSYAYLKVDLEEYYDNLPVEEAEKLREEVYATAPSDSVQYIFTTERPNIILITFEGWSAQMIEPLGGEKGITPHFNQLCTEGVLFSKIYATGGTSEVGHAAIMSGYPTLAGISISTESAKCRKLPSLNQVLEAEGYSTFYTFGGSLSYGNIGGYLSDVGFDRLIDENDLNIQPKGKLGIHDEAMFPYFLSEIQQAQRPYFYGMFTQSTHAPYDMPCSPYDGYEGDGYVTSMHYADQHLHQFIEEIKKLPDYDNTLVIMISDHGKTNIINADTYDEKYFHIPLLLWGGAIKPECRGMVIDKIGSQADLAKTLLNQLKLTSEDFHWSKDLMNPNSPEWALCTSTLSYGWKDTAGYTVYQMINAHLLKSAYPDEQKTDLVLKKCRAVLECMFREFKEL